MSEMRFTPGPWRQATGIGYCAIRTDAGVIANMRFVDRQYNPFDANLIAAAPELYEALLVAREYLAGFVDTTMRDPDIQNLEKVDAVLAKASGRVEDAPNQ